MRTVAASNAAWAATQLASILAVAYGLLWAMGILPPLHIIAASAATILGLVFLQRPDVGLLALLVARAASDATLGTFAVALGGSERLLTRFLNPNVALIMVLIVAGGIFLLARGLPFLSLPAGRVFALLLLTGLVGVLRSGDVVLSLNEWLPSVSAIVVYALAANLFRSPLQVQRAVDILGVSFVLPALFGFYQMATGIGRYLVDVGARRIHGTFVHPNPFGVYLMLIFSVFLCQAFVHRGRRRVVSLLVVAASGILILATYTRSVWVGVLVAVLVIGLLQHRRLLLLVPPAILLVLWAVPTTGARLGNPLSGSFAHRLTIWHALITEWTAVTGESQTWLSVAMDRLSGLGPGAFASLIPSTFVLPHNDYLRILTEFGVFGLVLFILMHALLIHMAYRSWRAAMGVVAAVPLSFLAVAVAFPIISMTDNLFASTVNQVYFWALAGLTAGIGMKFEGKAEDPIRRRSTGRWGTQSG